MDDGGRRCGSALLDADPMAAAVVVENERGRVGGAVRAMLAPPTSLSSLSLGEGGGEAVLRSETPLVTSVELVAAPAASHPFPGDTARASPAFVDALDSNSAG